VLTDEFYGNQGVRYWEKGELEKAEKFIRKAIAINPESSKWHQSLAFILNEQGKKDEAFKEFHRALDINDEWGSSHKTASLMALGSYYYEKRMYTESISFLEKALNEGKKENVDKLNLSYIYLYLSYNYEETEIENSFIDLEKSMDLKKKAYELNPDDLFIQASITKTLIIQGDIDEARRRISKLEVEIESVSGPSTAGVYAYLAYMYSLLNAPAKSALNMSKAIEDSPMHFSIYLLNELDGDFRNVSESKEMQPVIEKAKAIVGNR
jgi:tetratricopeptide (TPR) repeat protein